MLKVEVNKVTLQDVTPEVLERLERSATGENFDSAVNRIQNAMYTGRNYTLPYLKAESIICNGQTNLKQVKDLPKQVASERFLTTDTIQVAGKLIFERAKVTGTCNVLRKKDLTIEKMKPIVETIYNNYFAGNTIYLPIGANYVSDKDPTEILKGKWVLKEENNIGKIWERIG